MAPSLLITGATGFLGAICAFLAQDTWRVAGTFYRTRREVARALLPGIDLGRIDLTDYRDVREMIGAVNPDVVLHTAALADLDACERDSGASLRINLQASLDLAGLCADRGIPMIFTSTDVLFDGESPPYSEQDKPTPINVYGEHKAMAEEGILARNERALICRLPLLIGAGRAGRSTFFAHMVSELRAGRSLRLFSDDFRSAVSGRTAALGLLRLAGAGLDGDVNEDGLGPVAGIFHLGGREPVSRLQMGRMLVRKMGLDEDHLEPISLSDIDTIAARPRDVTLLSERAYELGYDPPSLETEIDALIA